VFLPIIMAGGSGTRLWPLSRTNYPKQFLNLCGEQSMLQQTVARLGGLSHTPSMLICNEEHRFIAAEQMRQLDEGHSGIFLEPVGRNTAPAIALAAIKATEAKEVVSRESLVVDQEKEVVSIESIVGCHKILDNDPVMLVLAADHVIEDVEAFQASIEQAHVLAESGKMVTFGCVATGPETGYGYVRRGAQVES